MRRKWIISVLIVALAAAGGWLWAVRRAPGRPNIILISMDTTRADRLSCYGGPPGTTPNIDAVAAHTTRFVNAIAQVPLTLPSHASMLTGLIPPAHGVHDNFKAALPEETITLAERLRQHGYQTAAVVGTFVLDTKFGLAQGFDFYDDEITDEVKFLADYSERFGEVVTDIALKWLDEQREEPFFLFVHYYDPHMPYRPPKPFGEIYADDLYLGEVAYTDFCIGRVVDRLKALGLYDDSLLIITGDHGESLGDHGETEHGYFIYHATTRVPLIVKLPRQQVPRVVEAKASITDLVPTIMSRVGAPVDGLDGYDLSPWLTNSAEPPPQRRFVYSETLVPTKFGCSPLLGLETQEWKYIQTTQPELYNLLDDPAESLNLVKEYRQLAAAFRDELAVHIEDALTRRRGDARLALDHESLRRLQSLGYTGGAVDESFRFDTDRPDAKDYIDVLHLLETLQHYIDVNDPDKAKEWAEKLLAVRPEIAFTHAKLGEVAIREQRFDDAISHLRNAIERDAGQPQWHNDLGALLSQKGQYDEAITHLTTALTLVLDEGKQNPLADSALPGQRPPVTLQALINLANSYHLMGETEKARNALEEAREHVPPGGIAAHFKLGQAYALQGMTDNAIAAFEKALELSPDYKPARHALDRILTKKNDVSAP